MDNQVIESAGIKNTPNDRIIATLFSVFIKGKNASDKTYLWPHLAKGGLFGNASVARSYHHSSRHFFWG
jgi:hypothetical protein